MKYLTQYVPQGSGEGMSDGYVVVEEDGVLKAQKLSFNGTEATPDGVTEAISNVGLFATGMDEPAYNGGGTGSSAKYYKCASVDTSNKTWTGYELILQDDVYVVSDTVTDGLTYTGFTPIVGTVYNEDTTLTIGAVFSKAETLEGCVFAANMQTTSATYNGETINLDGIVLADAPGYTDGTKAANKGNCSLAIDGANVFSDNKLSFAASVYTPNATSGGDPTILRIRKSDSDGSADTYLRLNGPQDQNYRGEVYASIACSKTVTTGYGWHHVAATSDSVTVKFYVDGVLVATGDYNGYGTPSSYISMYLNAASYRDAIFMKDLQIYNRVLSEDEIMSLYEKAKLPIA